MAFEKSPLILSVAAAVVISTYTKRAQNRWRHINQFSLFLTQTEIDESFHFAGRVGVCLFKTGNEGILFHKKPPTMLLYLKVRTEV